MSRYHFLKREIMLSNFMRDTLQAKYDNSNYTKKIIETIVSNFDNKKNLTFTALKINCSNRTLQRAVKSAFDITFTQLIRTLKIYMALVFIQEDTELYDIVVELSFSELNSLNRDLKTVLGITPTTARRKLQYMTVDEIFKENYHYKKLCHL